MSIGSTKKPKDSAISTRASRLADTVIRKFPYSEFASTDEVALAKQTTSLLDRPPLHSTAVRRPTLFKPKPQRVSHKSSKKRRVKRHPPKTQNQPEQKYAQHSKTKTSKLATLKSRSFKFKDTGTTAKIRPLPSLKFATLKKTALHLSSAGSAALGFRPLSRQAMGSKMILCAESNTSMDRQPSLIKESSVSFLAGSYHSLAVQVAAKMKLSAVSRIVDTHIVRPMIWSGMRATAVVKQATRSSICRSSGAPLTHRVQTATILPAVAVKAGRTAASHEVFVQRGNGLRTQTASASAVSAIAGQQQGTKQSNAPVMTAARWNPAVAMRGSGRANPMLAYPAPIIMQPLENIDRPEIQINDRLYSVIDQIEPEIGEELLACIMEQLGQGPESLGDNDIRIRANSLLPADMEKINANTWKALLQETLIAVFQNVLPFDGHGMKKREAIYADAALVLDMDEDLFAKWEACFSIDCLIENLVIETESSTRFVQEEYESVVRAISEQIGARANAALTPSHYQGAVIHSFETEAQWTAARFCAISNSRNKVATTTAHLAKIVKMDKNTAARILALIASYSGISRRPATRAPVPRWSKEELQSLIEGLSKHAPSLLTNAQFRSQLTPWENKAFNQLVHRVNHENSMDQLRKLSPKEPFEAFFDLLEKAGQEDEVLLDIWQDMARNLSKLN